MADFRTPLARARGLGAAKSGVGHFIAQRVSAIALLLLIPVFLWSVIALPSGGYEAARDWIASPLGALVMLLTLTAAFYHMRLGLQVVIEDYIHKSATKHILLIANTLIAAGLWIAALYAVIVIAVRAVTA
jgi:succinate dehydrogenase / fumarate reductase membrane anchor subunit